jgi:hypothetical protein
VRNQELLGQKLGGVSNRLEQPGPAYFRWTGTPLETAGALALDPDQVSGVQSHKGHDSAQEQDQANGLG